METCRGDRLDARRSGALRSLQRGLIFLNHGAAVPPTSRQDFQFGPFRLDGYRRSLTRDGARLSVGGRALDILLVLAAADGETVEKPALISQVWRGLTVEENNLQVHISALRKMLGDGWIITVPGRGYRLTTVATAPPSGELPLPERPSIAVLAFANMSGDSDQDFLSEGIADDIITELTRIRGLFVVARNSSFTYQAQSADVRLWRANWVSATY